MWSAVHGAFDREGAGPGCFACRGSNGDGYTGGDECGEDGADGRVGSLSHSNSAAGDLRSCRACAGIPEAVAEVFRLSSKLTITYDLRYELFSPMDEKFERQANFDFDKLTLFIPKGKDQDAKLPPNFATDFANVKVSRGEVSSYLIPWDKPSIAPLIGFAYSLDTKTAIRAGYGIFYGGEENQGGNPNRGEGVPFNQTTNLDRIGIGPYEQNRFFNGVQNGFPLNVFTTLNAPASFRSVAQNFRNPLVHKWNFSIQREFRGGNAFEVA